MLKLTTCLLLGAIVACGGHIESESTESHSTESAELVPSWAGTGEITDSEQPESPEEHQPEEPDLGATPEEPEPDEQPELAEPEPEPEPEPACVAEPIQLAPDADPRAKPCGKVRDECGELQDYGSCYGSEDLCGGDGVENICGVCREVTDSEILEICPGGARTGCAPSAYAQWGYDPITLADADGVFRLYLCRG